MKVGEYSLVRVRSALRVRAEGDIQNRRVAWQARTATQDLGERQIVGPDKRQPPAKAFELLLELAPPEMAELPRPHQHEHLTGLRKHLQDVVDESRKIVGDRDRSLVLARRRVAKKSRVDRREEERCVGKELLSMPAGEDRRRAGDSYDELRLGTIGEHGSDVVDDGSFRRADESCRADDDLDDVHGTLEALVEVDAEVAGEVVHRQAATVERLQHQDLVDRGLSFDRSRTDHQPGRQRRTLESARDSRHLRSDLIVL